MGLTYPGMQWAVVSPLSEGAIPVALAIAQAPRSATIAWIVRAEDGSAWNAACRGAWEAGADFLLLLGARMRLNAAAVAELVEKSRKGDFVGFKGRYVCHRSPEGTQARYVLAPPMVAVLSRAALDRVAGAPFQRQTALWGLMARRLGRYGVRPRLLEGPELAVFEWVPALTSYRGQDVTFDRLPAAL